MCEWLISALCLHPFVPARRPGSTPLYTSLRGDRWLFVRLDASGLGYGAGSKYAGEACMMRRWILDLLVRVLSSHRSSGSRSGVAGMRPSLSQEPLAGCSVVAAGGESAALGPQDALRKRQ